MKLNEARVGLVSPEFRLRPSLSDQRQPGDERLAVEVSPGFRLRPSLTHSNLSTACPDAACISSSAERATSTPGS